MTSTRDPLSVRTGRTILPAVSEGVPASLTPALRDWIWETVSLDTEEAQHTLIRLNLALPDAYWKRYQRELRERKVAQAELDVKWEAAQAAKPKQAETMYTLSRYERREFAPLPADPHALFLAYGTDAEILWDVVDDLLNALCTEPLPPDTPPLVVLMKRMSTKRTKKITASLRRLLEESRSVYEISPDQRGLQRRMEVFLAESVDRASASAEIAGYPMARVHLARAQDRLFALHPDPSGVYVEVILAVEAVASPLFLPNDQLPTLGKVRDHLRAAGDKYEYALANKSGTPTSTDGVVAMLSDLWEGHSDRHAGGPRSVQVSEESALVAFTIAVALVTLFSNGAVRQRCNGQDSRQTEGQAR